MVERERQVVVNEEPIIGIKLLLPCINNPLWRNLEIKGVAGI